MSTTLNIQNDVSIQLGKDNGSVAESKRDNAILRAKRKFYKEYAWSFLSKNADLTFTNGSVSFPADFDESFEPKIYSYDGILKTEYKLVPLEDVSGYTSDYPVFGIDFAAKAFKSNISAAVKITYQILVPDTIVPDYTEPCDDITPIVDLAIAYFWLLKERNDQMFTMWMSVYNKDLADAIRKDRLKQPVRKFKVDNTDYGYNGGGNDEE